MRHLFVSLLAAGLLFFPHLGNVNAEETKAPQSIQQTTCAEGKTCNPNTAADHQSNPESQISAADLQQAFIVLMAAFVLALLLESAFALLFNWRFYQSVFVGRAWRTPIMFAVSLAVVHELHFDMVARVFSAYNGSTAPPQAEMLTQILTAMVLGGGSVGVNKILVGLGFRSDKPRKDSETEQARNLHETEAWVSVMLQGVPSGRQFSVEMQEWATSQDYPQPAGNPIPDIDPTLALISPQNFRVLKSMFFVDKKRFPQSGGMRVTALKMRYRFVIRDIGNGQLYDLSGNAISARIQAKEFCFAPRAIVDFVVDMSRA